MVATCNVGVYDVPAQVYYSPTIRLYPVYEKEYPMQYFGDQTNVEEYIDFIEESGAKNFKPASRRNSPNIRELQE